MQMARPCFGVWGMTHGSNSIRPTCYMFVLQQHAGHPHISQQGQRYNHPQHHARQWPERKPTQSIGLEPRLWRRSVVRTRDWKLRDGQCVPVRCKRHEPHLPTKSKGKPGNPESQNTTKKTNDAVKSPTLVRVAATILWIVHEAEVVKKAIRASGKVRKSVQVVSRSPKNFVEHRLPDTMYACWPSMSTTTTWSIWRIMLRGDVQ